MIETEIEMANVLTAEKFSLEIERRRYESDDMLSYLELTTEYLEELGIDPDDGKPLISKTLLEKIYSEALDNNLLKEKSSTFKLV